MDTFRVGPVADFAVPNAANADPNPDSGKLPYAVNVWPVINCSCSGVLMYEVTVWVFVPSVNSNVSPVRSFNQLPPASCTLIGIPVVLPEPRIGSHRL